MKNILILLMMVSVTACAQEKKKTGQPATAEAAGKTAAMPKTEAEWKKKLTPEQYAVLREKATERPFTGEYYKHFEKGVYVCAACGNPLFRSDAKFDSECGWPSFDQAIKGSVKYEHDTSYGMDRTEVMCSRCGGHLGHVFDDGPKETTGNRFCTNSVSIKFVPAEK
ncbi:peptide-methionine (R)-S-oxide reductase [Flavobacterium cyanobacteriorum]|uniref:peptide-methionine (R)-S-oxide reductase n=1 Tax=Flavobacterium cyanobacteriorum TaxID=2022802 RepID=A0A255Z9H0_9FLAO|nr:peptide-methionine (R)-S-oxide reductase MsrB [Flavobacterium cyanobacteriorum]OYQ38089.1 peptide-methionine (R)-S-oxide reductase [Flavobacterium cyanobacteriorum]